MKTFKVILFTALFLSLSLSNQYSNKIYAANDFSVNYSVSKATVNYDETFTVSLTVTNNTPYTYGFRTTLNAWGGVNKNSGLTCSPNKVDYAVTCSTGNYWYVNFLNLGKGETRTSTQNFVFKKSASTVPGTYNFNKLLTEYSDQSTNSTNGWTSTIIAPPTQTATATQKPPTPTAIITPTPTSQLTPTDSPTPSPTEEPTPSNEISPTPTTDITPTPTEPNNDFDLIDLLSILLYLILVFGILAALIAGILYLKRLRNNRSKESE